jgi:hypothetical protein
MAKGMARSALKTINIHEDSDMEVVLAAWLVNSLTCAIALGCAIVYKIEQSVYVGFTP